MKQTLAATRSLGRAGLRLALAERYDPVEGRPPAFWSRWSASTSLLPDYVTYPDDFAAGVMELILTARPAVVIPSSDQSIACLRPWRSQIERHTHLALASEPALAVAVDKKATLALAERIGIGVPKMVALDDNDDLCSALEGMTYPAVVKPRWSWARDSKGDRVISVAVLNYAEAQAAIHDLRRAGVPGLVQEL
ncbi:MAG TPA: hypothetical protein VME46_26395, partial [Acidimicrobiales bacterium]|nr:hypothetical protein [Acidimicrobiales bacterium]